jgi:hypothetical protein
VFISYLSVVLIFIFLMSREVDYFFIYLLAIHMPSFEWYLFQDLWALFNQIIFFSLAIELVWAHYQIHGLQIFLPINRLSLCFPCCAELLDWCNPIHPFLLFLPLVLGLCPKIIDHRNVIEFSPGSFIVSGAMFKSLIHFELIFVYGVRYGPISFFSFSNTIYQGDCPLSIVFSWLFCWKLIDHKMSCFIYGLFVLSHWPMCLFFFF